MKTEKQQQKAAAEFAERWQGRGYEKGDSQIFWADLLTNVFGVENIAGFIRYEEQVKVDKTNFIDGHIPSTRVLIEQKSLGKDLRKGILQSDGSLLNPFQQAKRYVANMPLSEHPRWIVTCNFSEFLVYDMEQPNGEPEQILLENLGREYYRLTFLVDAGNEHLSKEMQVSMQAGEIVGKIYEALLTQYDDNSPEALRWLNILCVRIVFCLYAEDAGVFRHDQFHDFLARYEAKDLRRALRDLFEVLNTPKEKRSKYLQDDLRDFPYTNGGLFEEDIEIPQITEELKQTILQNASLDFDWSEISPTIFGAVFESTLNPDTRRSGGMHYTSIENIHKVIDPLFLNDLRHELDDILEERIEKARQRKLDAYQDKLARLTFLDPACGSGNFLTETYLSLRRLENEVIRERTHGQTQLAWEGLSPVKVSIHQFYGIEINDFAVTVATTALWISEAQMLAETEKIIRHDIDFLPLRSYTNIREGNALRMDWDVIERNENIPTIHAKNTYVIFDQKPLLANEPVEYNDVNLLTTSIQSGPKSPTKECVHFDYIIGNPPFVGYKEKNKRQKEDLEIACLDKTSKPLKSTGTLDYVSGWYYKAARLMETSTKTRAAFVSTNSITQGEQVALMWKCLFEEYGISLDFAYKTFVWNSETKEKAKVHCVIIGFSREGRKEHLIYKDNDHFEKYNRINAYLYDAPDIWISSIRKPLSAPKDVTLGVHIFDNHYFIFTEAEKKDFVKEEPASEPYFKKWVSASDFLYGKCRYFLDLQNCPPNELRKMPMSYERVRKVMQYRETNPSAKGTNLALYPFKPKQGWKADRPYIIIPNTSGQNRKYLPIGFQTPDTIVTMPDLALPDGDLFDFGVISSNVHMAWIRVVCGRLKSDYRYSNGLVYNNFPWPSPTDVQRRKIEQTAQTILDARALYPDSSLADLYDEVAMPVELRRAHQANDCAVMEAYGFPWRTMTETECVAELFRLYESLAKNADVAVR